MLEEFRVTIAKQTTSRELRALAYRKLIARPKHDRAGVAVDRVSLGARPSKA
jgi:hypothetical protein